MVKIVFSQYVTRTGARMLVQRAIRDEREVANHPPHELIATENTVVVARCLVDAIFDRLQRRVATRSSYEVSLVEELADRDTRESAEIFAAEAERAWIRQHENGYPASGLDSETRHEPHGSPGHDCWQPTNDRQRMKDDSRLALDIGSWVEVASYIGAAAMGGIIGNRADAVVVGLARWLFVSVDHRWHKRVTTVDAALNKEEAADAAKASAMANGYGRWTLLVTSATQEMDNSWIILLDARCPVGQCREYLRARIPPGDPFEARFILYVRPSIYSKNCPH